MVYNPFNKELSALEWDDLSALDTVSEGFYIDYKRKLSQDNSKTAKEISSFANTDGGLLIVGVDEANDNTAGSILGVDIDTQDPKVRIRNIIQHHINPPPQFKTFIVEKDNDPAKGAVIVSIPKSKDAPHITNNGKIYRRTGEGSDPYDYETDAKIVDRLHRRGEKFDQEMSEFCVPDTGVTKRERDSTFLEIYAVPSNKDTTTCRELAKDVSRFKEIAQNREREIPLLADSEDDKTLNIEKEEFFDSILSTSDGVVAQKWIPNRNGVIEYAHPPLTVKFFANGSIKIRLPVSNFRPPSPSAFREKEEKLKRPWEAIHEEVQDDYTSITYLDGETLMYRCIFLLDLYFELLEEASWFEEQAGQLHFKGIIRNSFRNMAIFQSKWFEDLVDTNGPPISYDEEVIIPQMGYMKIDSTDQIGAFLLQFSRAALSGLGLPQDYMHEVWANLVGSEENI